MVSLQKKTIPLVNVFKELQECRKLGFPPPYYCQEVDDYEPIECPSESELLMYARELNRIQTILKTRSLQPEEILQYNELKIVFEKIKTQWIIPYGIQLDMEDILGEDYTIEFRQRCMGCQFCLHSARIDVAVYYEKVSLNNQLTRFRKKQSYLDFFSIESEVHQIRTQYVSEPFTLPTERDLIELKILIRKWILLHSICHCGDEKCLSLPIEINITIPEKGKKTSKLIKISHTRAAIFALLKRTDDKLVLIMGEILIE